MKHGTHSSKNPIREVCADGKDEETPNIEIHEGFPNLVPLDIVILSAAVGSTNALESDFFLSWGNELCSWTIWAARQSLLNATNRSMRVQVQLNSHVIGKLPPDYERP